MVNWFTTQLLFPCGSDCKESACNEGDLGSIPGLGRSPGEGLGYPLQYSCLENPVDRGAWWATVHRSQRVGHNWATSLSLFSPFSLSLPSLNQFCPVVNWAPLPTWPQWGRNVRQFHRKRTVFSTNGTGTTEYPHAKELIWASILSHL